MILAIIILASALAVSLYLLGVTYYMFRKTVFEWAEVKHENCVLKDKLKTVDAKPVKLGHWKLTNNPSYRKCSECGGWHDRDVTNFCPKCGADMRGDSDG